MQWSSQFVLVLKRVSHVPNLGFSFIHSPSPRNHSYWVPSSKSGIHTHQPFYVYYCIYNIYTLDILYNVSIHIISYLHIQTHAWSCMRQKLWQYKSPPTFWTNLEVWSFARQRWCRRVARASGSRGWMCFPLIERVHYCMLYHWCFVSSLLPYQNKGIWCAGCRRWSCLRTNDVSKHGHAVTHRTWTFIPASDFLNNLLLFFPLG